jgi:NAD(P)H-flavin reductase
MRFSIAIGGFVDYGQNNFHHKTLRHGIRPCEGGERIPLTIANADPSEGWIEIIFQVVGKSTMLLAELDQGEEVSDLAGPLGKPTDIEKFGRCLCIGGGVGVAPLFPIICALREIGNNVTSIIGARNSGLLMLENEIKVRSDRMSFVPTTDRKVRKDSFQTFLTILLRRETPLTRLLSSGRRS